MSRFCGARPVVELGAGRGYWAGQLSRAGLVVDAYELEPPNKIENVSFPRAEGQLDTWYPVAALDEADQRVDRTRGWLGGPDDRQVAASYVAGEDEAVVGALRDPEIDGGGAEALGFHRFVDPSVLPSPFRPVNVRNRNSTARMRAAVTPMMKATTTFGPRMESGP